MACVLVDYDGTITDLDTFDVLVRRAAGVEVWGALERDLEGGRRSLRDTLQRQASHVRLRVDDADAMLRREVRFDPSFAEFAQRTLRQGHELTIVSSGIAPLIRKALERNALSHLALVANEIEASPAGWRILFDGDSENGTDKVGLVRAAQRQGKKVVYIGDGWSDLEAALASDVRYVKTGRTLERELRARRVHFIPFTHFSEIDPAQL